MFLHPKGKDLDQKEQHHQYLHEQNLRPKKEENWLNVDNPLNLE